MQSGQEGYIIMRLRKALSFLVLLIYALCAGLVLFRPAADSLSVLRNGYGTACYEAIGVGEDGEVAAAGRDGEKLRLAFGTLAGERLDSWSARLPAAAAKGSLARLYPVGKNTVFLAVYEDGEENWSELAVYRIVRSKAAEALLRIPCTGDSAALRRDSVQISTFSRENGEVRFAVTSPDGIQGYACRENSGGVEERERQPEQPALSAAVLPDGSLAVGGVGFLTLDGETVAGDLSKQNITYLTQAGAGLFYLDSAGLAVFYSDLTGTGVREALQLGVNQELDDVTDLAITGQGGVLLLLGGHRLVLDQGRTCTELTGMLYRSAGASWALLLGAGLGLLLLTVLIWYGLEGRGSGQVSVAVRWGGILLAGALTICTVLLLFVIRPAQEENHRTVAENALSGAVSLAAPQWEGDAARLTRALTCAMERTASGRYRDVTARAYLPDGDGWVLEAPAGGMSAGTRGEVTGSFSAALAQKAREEGIASRLEGGRFELYLRGNLGLVVLTADDSTLMGWMNRQEIVLEIALLVGIALLLLLGVVNLVVVALGMRSLARGMERLAEGDYKTRVNIHSGDELEGLSSSLNSLAKAMEKQERKREDLSRSYRRFVPERVLALLGKQSILEVDKSTLATRRMAVMMVAFSFPHQVYDSRMREFFDSVNQVIERTAGVVSRMGGTVFNFAYNGYDVVLEGDEALAVSTAVAVRQEVLAINEARDLAGLPTVRLSIALDIGDVMVGVVGDESQMEPTTLSTSFTTVKRLIRLCSRLEAGILCTESMIAGAKEYGSRYMGRSGQGEQSVRVYEIFEGDAYDVRRLKESTVGEFTQAVYALYSQDYAAAKRTFLELVHNGQADGGARYYLYLSDKLEKGGGGNISLD